jgi:tRNA threonylcarbamoyladenosine biosynthesis protein TsaE
MPILDDRSFEFFSHSPEQTRRVGIRLGSLLKPGDVICLEGNLGAGKTTFVQGISQGWGSLDPVSSPTYVIVNEYRHPELGILFHVDAYRLAGSTDAEMLDFDVMLRSGVMVIEWAERIKEVLPGENLWIKMNWISSEQRYMHFIGDGLRHESLNTLLKQSIFGGD